MGSLASGLGLAGNHSYDAFIIGSRQPYTWAEVDSVDRERLGAVVSRRRHVELPECYAATRRVECAVIAMQDAERRVTRFERDRHRNLTRLTSPGGRGIVFEYDASHRSSARPTIAVAA